MLLKSRYDRLPVQVRFPVEVCIAARHAAKEVRGGIRVRFGSFAPKGSACSDGLVRAELHRSARVISDLDFFSDGKGIVDLDTEVPHRTLNLGVAEQ